MVILYIYSFFRTVLIVLGVLFLLRIFGKIMVAKRNLQEQSQMKKDFEADKKMVDDAKRNYGKTTISKPGSSSISNQEYTDFEEVDS